MMDIENVSVEERFYQDVAELLRVENNWEHNPHKGWRTRWNNRKPGNGRFEGYGLIRFFGPTMIHVVLNKPLKINKVFNSTEEVLAVLKKAVDDSQNQV